MIVCIKKKQPTKPSDLLPLLFPHDQMTLRSCQTAHIEPLARTRSGASASEPCRVVSGRDLDRFSYAPPPLGTTGTRSITFPRSWSLITGKKKEESKQHGHVVATLTSSSSSGLLPVYCSDRAQVLITEQSCVAFNPQHVACPVQSTYYCFCTYCWDQGRRARPKTLCADGGGAGSRAVTASLKSS